MIAGAVVIATTAAVAQQPHTFAVESGREEDLRIVEIVLDDLVLSEAIAAYGGSSGGTLLPLQGLSELVGVAIVVDPAEGVARGFVLDERRTFQLDVARRQVTIAGKTTRIEAALVRVHEDDIYVDSALLGSWLPATFDVDLFALRVRVRPREPLPLQRRLERERRIRHWRLGLPPADPGYPRQETPYRIWEVPSVDQSLRLSLGESSQVGFATYATGDLLFMESEAYLAGDREDLFDTARLTLRRRDPGGSIGGALRATEIGIGHVIHPSSALLTTSGESLPGVLLTNLPLNRPTEFDRHEFRGNLPPGWDVELYHNGTLVDYQQSRSDGQYLFANVPVLFGMNFFRLVFYGPQGQRREEQHRFLLGESLTLPGRFEYRVVANVERADARRASALVSYGLSRHLTATAETASLPTVSGERRYGKMGLRTFWSALFAYGDIVQDDHGGRAWDAGLQTRIFGVNVVVAREALSRGFVSEAFPLTADPIVSRDRVRLDAAVPAWVLPRIPVSFELERHRLVSGATRTSAQNRLSLHYKGLSMTNRLVWTSIDGQPSRTDGSLQMSRYVRGFGIRGELSYALAPTLFTTANVTVEKPLASGYRVFATVSRTLHGAGHSYSIGFDKTSGSIAAGVHAIRDGQGNTGVNVDLSAGVGRDPRAGAWVPSARPRAATGAASARVFLDRDENGRFDAGDQPLSGVGFTVNGIERPERTSDSGGVFLPDLTAHYAADVALDPRTLEDPQWIAVTAGVRIMPRPGKAVLIDVAVVATAEIEGSVSRVRKGAREEVGGANVELVDMAGNVVGQTTTAYDGFYVLTHVRRGRYRVRVAQDAGAPAGVAVASELEQAVTVTLSEPVISGIEIVLRRTESAPQLQPRPGIPEQPASRAAAAPVDRAPDAPRNFVVQIGSFSVAANAVRQADLVRKSAPDVRVVRAGAYMVVRSERRTRAEAGRLVRELASRGIEATLLQVGGNRSVAASLGRYVVQLGAFSVARNAVELMKRIEQRGGGWRTTIDRRGALLFVQTTPFASIEEANTAREALRNLGFEAVVRESD